MAPSPSARSRDIGTHRAKSPTLPAAGTGHEPSMMSAASCNMVQRASATARSPKKDKWSRRTCVW